MAGDAKWKRLKENNFQSGTIINSRANSDETENDAILAADVMLSAPFHLVGDGNRSSLVWSVRFLHHRFPSGY